MAIPYWEDACPGGLPPRLGPTSANDRKAPWVLIWELKITFHEYTDLQMQNLHRSRLACLMNSRNKLEDEPHPVSDWYLKSIESDSNPGSLGFICFENVIQIKCSLCSYAWKA